MFDPLTLRSFHLVSHRVTVLMLNRVRRLINRAAPALETILPARIEEFDYSV